MVILVMTLSALVSYCWGFFIGYKCARKWHWEAGFVAGHDAEFIDQMKGGKTYVMEIKE